ncbi:hypothetical protein Ade02nite_17070 [Paractinoplanes deccanensis]|uniref:Uncharacterized protein n=1 Tax=Paractinoplanes deccanensis TaxID=113561 RepID=A0ABQ3XZ99_9ACTN|nr:hypothetical protein [Actinoplanes deccanensis]GID73066.1 hypothetical protein Ade02nite_17070 [Actinoplanes deccanensis]
MDLQGKKTGRTSVVVLTLASAFAGAILGAVVQNEINGPRRPLEMAVGLLGLTVIGLSAAVVAMTRSTQHAVEGLSQILDITVRCQMLQDVNRYRAPGDDLVVRAFQEAEREILVLDRVTDEGVRPDVQMQSNVMAWHLDAILDRVEKAGIRYRRYCQVPDTSKPFGGDQPGLQAENTFVRHCLRMCEMHAAGRDVSLRVTPTTFPYKFLIVDRKILILQLQELRETDDGRWEPRTRCELVISDPRGQLIQHFLAMWVELEGHHKTRSLDARSSEMVALAAAGRTRAAG